MSAPTVPAVVKKLADATVVMTGNVVAGLQFSGYIRPHCATECNGFTREPGHLREFDLKLFRNYYPDAARLADRFKDKSESLILYAWRRSRPECKGGGTIVYGATLTDNAHNVIARYARPHQARALDVVLFLESRAGLRSEAIRVRA